MTNKNKAYVSTGFLRGEEGLELHCLALRNGVVWGQKNWSRARERIASSNVWVELEDSLMAS